jgi:hypothetical protein
MSPRLVAHGIAAFVALAALASGIAGVATGVPAALSIFCLVISLVLGVMIPLSLRGSRAAWSLLVSVLSVEAVGTFFGAATLAKALHTSIAFTLVLPLVLAGGVVALVSISDDYPGD